MARIFLVEDDRTTQLIIQTILEKEGHEVLAFDNGNKVINAISNNNPDLLITDLVMDGKEGIELIVEIKGIDASLPIIVMSSHEDYLNMTDAFSVSATILKPVAKDNLIETINGLLN